MMEEEDACSECRVRSKVRKIRKGMGRTNGKWWHRKR